MPPSRLPSYYISHGGGPWPWMETGTAFERLEASLHAIHREVRDVPRAVLVVTGHWEAPEFAVSSGEQPGMIYDYRGFPEHTYHIRYAAPGSPALAERVAALLEGGGIGAHTDPERGFDHGTFSLLKPLYPDEDMPIVQLSLNANYDPELHLKAGERLALLRDEGVLIIGSGSSFHDLRNWGPQGQRASRAFDAWLQDTLVHAAPAERRSRLAHWTQAPAAREAHPEEDHLLPLMVAVGAAENEPGTCVYHEDAFMGAIALSSFRFGEAPVR